MREKRNILISIGLGAVLGWTLGFLRLPFLEKNYSFLLGFIACLSLISLGLLVMYIWKENTSFSNLFRKNAINENTSKSYSFLWFLVSLFIVFGGLASSFLFFKQIEFSKNQTQHLDKKSVEQLELMASIRKSNALVVMNNLFEKIDKELKNNPKRILSNEVIERIAALNYSFAPYRYLEGNQLSEKKWSPERAQLLLFLTKMSIDSSSFNQIKRKTSFLGADLRNVDLTGADLSNTDLRQANFDHANLAGANLNNAILEKASLQKTNLEKASLQKTNFRSSDLRWSNLNFAKMQEAKLIGADLSNAKLREVDLSEANLQGAILSNVFLNKANLTKAKLLEANLRQANLENVDFTEANLILAILNEANMTSVNLTSANLLSAKVDVDNWLDKLDTWQVIGAKEVQESYKIGDDAFPRYKYKLNRKKK